MRILLVSPESEVWNSRKHIHMGLGYLAGSLLAQGYEVEIWDAAVEEAFETLAEKLSRDPFDVVGVSADDLIHLMRTLNLLDTASNLEHRLSEVKQELEIAKKDTDLAQYLMHTNLYYHERESAVKKVVADLELDKLILKESLDFLKPKG